MAAVDVHCDLSELARAVEDIASHAQEVALPIVGETISSAIDALIRSTGRTGTDGPWEPFSPVTFKIHPRREGGHLLQNTGELANMQTEVGPDWVEVGSPAPYAQYQREGVDPNPLPNLGPIPARDFLAIDLERALDEAAESILEAVTR